MFRSNEEYQVARLRSRMLQGSEVRFEEVDVSLPSRGRVIETREDRVKGIKEHLQGRGTCWW